MPTLDEATAQRDLSAYHPVEPPPPLASPYFPTYPGSPNQFLRCPLPPAPNTPDSLRQYYRGGEIPQTRVLPPNLS